MNDLLTHFVPILPLTVNFPVFSRIYYIILESLEIKENESEMGQVIDFYNSKKLNWTCSGKEFPMNSLFEC